MGTFDMKQVVFIVDTTSAMAPYWKDLKANYILPIIRNFNETESLAKG